MYAVDNILDMRYFDTVLRELAERPRPPRLFYETKANLTKDQLRLLARAGVRGIQPGIESLSTPILRLMDKGVSGLQNVRAAEVVRGGRDAAGVEHPVRLPGRGAGRVPADGRAGALADAPQPPAGGGRLRLDRFSPYFDEAEANGLVNVRPSDAYRHVYPFAPAALDRLAYYFDYDYADGRDPGAVRGAARGQPSRAGGRRPDRPSGAARRGRPPGAAGHPPGGGPPADDAGGPARLAYLALDAGNTVDGVHAALEEDAGGAAPRGAEVAGWLEAWRRTAW